MSIPILEITSSILLAVIVFQSVTIWKWRKKFAARVMEMKFELAKDLSALTCKNCGHYIIGMYTAAEVE